jgi:hypothetical protein
MRIKKSASFYIIGYLLELKIESGDFIVFLDCFWKFGDLGSQKNTKISLISKN